MLRRLFLVSALSVSLGGCFSAFAAKWSPYYEDRLAAELPHGAASPAVREFFLRHGFVEWSGIGTRPKRFFYYEPQFRTWSGHDDREEWVRVTIDVHLDEAGLVQKTEVVAMGTGL
jgi:hypothetical protein